MKPALLILIIVATALASSFATCLVMFAVLDRPNMVFVRPTGSAPAVYANSTPPARVPDAAVDTTPPRAPVAPAPVTEPVAVQPPVVPDPIALDPASATAPAQASDNANPQPDAAVVAQNTVQNPTDGGQTVAQVPAAVQVSTLPPAVETIYVPAPPPVVQQVLVPVPVNVSTTNIGIVGNPGNLGNPGYAGTPHPAPVVATPATFAAPVTTSSNPQAIGIFRQPSPHPTVPTIHPSLPTHN
jgi:hypothetical protein